MGQLFVGCVTREKGTKPSDGVHWAISQGSGSSWPAALYMGPICDLSDSLTVFLNQGSCGSDGDLRRALIPVLGDCLGRHAICWIVHTIGFALLQVPLGYDSQAKC